MIEIHRALETIIQDLWIGEFPQNRSILHSDPPLTFLGAATQMNTEQGGLPVGGERSASRLKLSPSRKTPARGVCQDDVCFRRQIAQPSEDDGADRADRVIELRRSE